MAQKRHINRVRQHSEHGRRGVLVWLSASRVAVRPGLRNEECARAVGESRGRHAAYSGLLLAAWREPWNLDRDGPSQANDIDFGFYLNNLQHGSTRGCVVVGSQAWVSPAMPVEFLTDGRLNSPVVALPCPMSHGTPVHYNDLDAAWQSSGTSNVLTQLTPTFNGTALTGVPSSFPQPPAGTNGFLLGFPIDNFKNAFWSQNGSLTSGLAVHKYAKSATWYG
jgi:hypothetical protein